MAHKVVEADDFERGDTEFEPDPIQTQTAKITSDGYPATNAFYSAQDFQNDISPMSEVQAAAVANKHLNIVKPLQTNSLIQPTGSVRNLTSDGIKLTFTEPVKQVMPKSAHIKTAVFCQEVDKSHEEHKDQRT